jgi:iron complex outermembrane receptor protein
MKSLLTGIMLFFSAVLFAQETTKNAQNAAEKDSVTTVPITELEGVTIFGNKKQFIKVESDKTTINIKENPMLSTGNALDAVKKLPGVISSPTGSLTLNSKGVTIYIDNAPSTLSGQDLQNYLSSLPANAI